MASQSTHYIIIGGGTSGLVVANRLSDDPETHVLVLEAGSNMLDDPRVNIPAFWTTLMGSEADWQFETVPQSGLNNRTLKEPQGKALGGSSAINGQAFICASQQGMDGWAKLGNEGWDWKSMLPFFKKSYMLVPPKDQATLDHLGLDWIDKEFHGTTGPIKASFPGVIENPLGKAWIDAFKSLNKITTADPMSGKSTGAFSNAVSVDPATNTRSYSGSTHGVELLKKSNVTVLTGATVQRIIFEGSGDDVVAIGVQVLVNGEMKTLTASKEVILAAGTINSPKLLELSGIGQKELLEKHKIPVIIDSPGVGENLQDHLMTGVSYEVVDSVVTGDPLMRQEPEALAEAQELYVKHKSGPFTIGGVQSYGLMPMEVPNLDDLLKQAPKTNNPSLADINAIVGSILGDPSEASASQFMFLAQANFHQYSKSKSFVGGELHPQNFASLGCSQTHALSRGNTHIASANAEDKPIIDPRYFSHPADLEIMARHLQSLESLRHTKELAPFFKVNGARNHPDAFKISDLGEAKKYVRDTASTTYHLCGTAIMLPREKGGVVDAKLKVYGTKNLRIVDASIIPIISRGNPQFTVYAVAERAADIIKNAWKQKH